MTTIAASREMMVSDSRVVTDNHGIAYPAEKIARVGQRIVGASGDGGDCSRFLEWARKDFKGAEPKWKAPTTSDSAMVGIILDRDGIYMFTAGDPEPERISAEFFAIGSGGDAARAAMKLGLDPVKAVELACEIDCVYSGLPLQILKLKEE